MAGTINDFRASFKGDIARPHRFDVMIPVPLTLIQYRNIAQQLTLRCEAAEMPGRTLATMEQKIYGPTEKFPYHTTYTDMNLTFMVSEDMAEKQFFDAWMELINPTTNFNFKYKGDYATPITINQYDLQNQKTFSVDLIDAYPISVNQLDLAWNNDGYHKLAVTFAYTYWKNNSVQNVLNSAITAGIGGFIDKVTGVSGLGGNIIS